MPDVAASNASRGTAARLTEAHDVPLSLLEKSSAALCVCASLSAEIGKAVGNRLQECVYLAAEQ